MESPEYLRVYLDGDNKVLFGIKTDGSVEWFAGVPTPIRKEIDRILEKIDETLTVRVQEIEELLQQMTETYGTVIDNPEWIRLYTDDDNHVLWGIKSDGSIEWGKGVPTPIRNAINALYKYIDTSIEETEEKLNYLTIITSPEYVFAVVDGEDKFLFGIKTNGNVEWSKGLPAPVKKEFEKVYARYDSQIESLNSSVVQLNDFKDRVEAVFSVEDNPEGIMEATTDRDKRLLGYRDKDGIRHEQYLAIEKSLNLSEGAMTDFQQALKDAGFQPGGGGDWTDREVIELPEPKHYALLNIDVDYLPTNDGDVRGAVIQYYDGLGNSFKMDAEIEAQGQTSRVFAYTGGKGNYTLDLSKDVKFGSWVPQDSFHLKGAAKDVTRGILPTSYKWAYLMQEYLDARPNRVLLQADSKTTTTSASGDRFTDWGDGARCLPDGFPVELYINGEYYGLYAIQLKKHRKNYSMDKKDYTSLFLDADKMMSNNYTHGIWNDGPDATDPDRDVAIKWWERFDIKGPKDLICMDGSEFDGDAPKELIDDTSTVYDASNKKHKGSAQAKAIIRGFQTKYLEVKTLIDNSELVAAKAKFEENFDKDACMFVFIYNCLMKNNDSVKKNTLWGTYKNGKIFPALWDLDGMYGTGWVGNSASVPSTDTWSIYANAAWPLALLWTLYEDEIKATYADLRSKGIISGGTWHDIVYGQWIDRIGEEAYKRDMERWPETPSYRENCTNTEYWTEIGLTDSPGSTPVWNENLSVNANDVVVIRCHTIVRTGLYMVWMRYRAKVANTGVCPVTKFYTEFPIVGGFFDSPRRWEKWITRQIELCDSLMGYAE